MLKSRTYKVGLHSLTVKEQDGIITSIKDGSEAVTYDSIREAAVSIGDTVGDWITKSILAEAASESLDIWKELKNGQSRTDKYRLG